MGQAFAAAGYVIEEKLLSQHEEYDALLMSGIEGVWVTIISLVGLPILQIIPCKNLGVEMCPEGTLENSITAI